MNLHPSIRCDKCKVKPVVGFRHACLVCEDYDLCDECHQKKRDSNDHRAFHPMLPILAPADQSKAFKNLTPAQIKVFTCPYCGDGKLSIDTLAAHCLEYHSFKSCQVRCPICVTFNVQGKKHWIAEDTLLLHLLNHHQNEDGYVLDLNGNGNDCSVCVEKISNYDSKKLVCGHVFHGSCINKWLRNQSTCPLCRKDVGSNRARDDIAEIVRLFARNQ